MQKTGNKTVMILGLILLALSLFLTIGVKTAFSACGPQEDGSYMSCHWAGQAVFGMGIVLTIQAALALFAPQRMRSGITLAMVPVAIVTAAVPGGLIRLCVMPGMHCQAVMRPFAITMAVVIAVVAAVYAWAAAKKQS